ncbi:MAG: GGDEF domain-containing protein [Pirellulales bacterium]|nr:GGDEF domain-containing protein [Pirellulales bacterium]
MLASFLFTQGLLVDTAALASVALVGYLFGRRTRRLSTTSDVTLLIELARAQTISKELEHIAVRARTEAAALVRHVSGFQGQIGMMQTGSATAGWQNLREQADALLGPTMRLTTTLSLACDELRQQQAQLMTYAGSRIDPETGLHNRRSMSEHLEALLSAHADGERRLALGVFSVSLANDEAADSAEAQLRTMAHLIEQCVRGHDVVARYSQDEFVVLMPKTPLAGALGFGERLLRLVDAEMECVVRGGLVEAGPGETPVGLLSRADSALYSARTHEEACLFQHNGVSVRRHSFELKSPFDDSVDEQLVAVLL